MWNAKREINEVASLANQSKLRHFRPVTLPAYNRRKGKNLTASSEYKRYASCMSI
jgi:hypothetical protein